MKQSRKTGKKRCQDYIAVSGSSDIILAQLMQCLMGLESQKDFVVDRVVIATVICDNFISLLSFDYLLGEMVFPYP